METRELNPGLLARVKQAREIRETHFPGQICFATPKSTTVITMTGNHCDLNCAHCGGKYLEHMTPVEEAAAMIARNGATSCLISGGCSGQGHVAINLDPIQSAIQGLKVNTHVGLISEREIQALAPYVDTVSFDFLVDEETIREVYHLPDRKKTDYIETYQMLRKYVKVMPHICIGLNGGKVSGEYAAMDVLRELGVDGLVFIVFIPTKGTEFADRQPPAIEEVVEVLVRAREQFPTVPIHLGCMRPKGRYRAILDYYAVEAGVNKLVNPTPPAVKRAEELGYEIILQDDCCVL